MKEEIPLLITLNYSAFTLSHKEPPSLHFRSVHGEAMSPALIDTILEVVTELCRPSIGSETRIGGLPVTICGLNSDNSMFQAHINRLFTQLQQKLSLDEREMKSRFQPDGYSYLIAGYLNTVLERLHPLSLR